MESEAGKSLSCLGKSPSLFHTPVGEGYAIIPINGHSETWALNSRGFERWVAAQFYEKCSRPPRRSALKDAIRMLEARAQFSSPELPVFVRLAEWKGTIYLDLCNDAWEVIEITPLGWRITRNSPVKFIRAPGMRPLPPPQRGGSLGDLRRFINVPDERDWVLCVSWLLASLRPSGPFPILNILATQGGGKSTMERMLRDLIDPSIADLRCPPRSERDLLIAANNSWVLAFDNLSAIKEWQSDAFCRLSTGGGISTRKLYTNGEEYIANPIRPIITNGIDYLPNREDFLDRSMNIHLPQIPDKGRIPEKELWEKFHMAQPFILGVMFDIVSSALLNLPHTQLGSYPRMADFVQWVASGENALPWKPGSFLKTYEENRRFAIQDSLEGNKIISAMQKMLMQKKSWTGTATDLLNTLESYTDQGDRRSWPKLASELSGILHRAEKSLQSVGIDLIFRREAGTGKKFIDISHNQAQRTTP